MTAHAATPLPSSWLRALADRADLGAVAFGGLLCGVLLVAFAVWELALGRLAAARLPGDPQTVVSDAIVAANHILCTAYLAAAFVHALRASERSFERVRPLLAAGSPPQGAVAAFSERSVLVVAGLLGAGTSLFITLVGPGEVSLDPRFWTAEVAWHRVLAVAMGFLIFRLGALLLSQSIRLSRLAAGIREIDLLDLSPLAPFAQQGLMNALLLLGFVATYALFLVDLSYLRLVVPISIVAGGVAGLGLLLPLLGTRSRIRDAKQSELSWCRERIRQARRELGEGVALPPQPAPVRGGAEARARRVRRARLDELVAWEARVESVREWPLDAAALQRFGLYLLIPLGSWSGGALVERLIDRMLE